MRLSLILAAALACASAPFAKASDNTLGNQLGMFRVHARLLQPSADCDKVTGGHCLTCQYEENTTNVLCTKCEEKHALKNDYTCTPCTLATDNCVACEYFADGGQGQERLVCSKCATGWTLDTDTESCEETTSTTTTTTKGAAAAANTGNDEKDTTSNAQFVAAASSVILGCTMTATLLL